jgi:hypothetical protein
MPALVRTILPVLPIMIHNHSPYSIKREIGHLCHDEQRPPKTKQESAPPTTMTPTSNADTTTRIIPRT